jgi:hypothetical protein
MTDTLTFHGELDRLEAAMQGHTPAECPVTHRFAPGLYIREIFIPAGTLLTSALHKTEHPFVLAMGRIAVISETEGRVLYHAPHVGITPAGTRRALYAETDVVWVTIHKTDKTDLAEICADLIEDRPNPLLPDFQPQYLPS